MSEDKEQRSKRQQRYDEHIAHVTRNAREIGRREPYHLTYIKKHREVKPNDKE